MTGPFRDPPAATPDVLICAGLDPSGGAGFIADVRVVSALGGRPVGVVTAATVQNSTGVIEVEAMRPDGVREQLEFLLSDVEVRAVKIGMLGSIEIARSIGAALALTGAPVVWDPVVHPSRGAVRLLDQQLAQAVTVLLPHLALITPNAAELALLTGERVDSLADAIAAGRALTRRLAVPVLVKGGHVGGAPARDGDEAIDVLCDADGEEELRGPRIADGAAVHGTGCALSSAIATGLARGVGMLEACRVAKAWVAARIASPARPGRGAAAIV